MTNPLRFKRFGIPVLIGFSLLSAAFADFLFYDRVVGWTLGGFTFWLYALIVLRHGRAAVTGRARALGGALLVASLGLCIALVLEPGTLALLLALMGLGSVVLLARGGMPQLRLGWAWLLRLVGLWSSAWVRPLLDLQIVQRWLRRTRRLRGRAYSAAKAAWALAGVLVPLAVSLVFLGLFALANPVIEAWGDRAFDWSLGVLDDAGAYLNPLRWVFWALVAGVCWGLLRHRPLRTRRRAAAATAPGPARPQTPPAAGPGHPIQAAADRKRAEHGADAPVMDEAAVLAEQARARIAQRRADKLAWTTGQYQGLIVRCILVLNIVFLFQLVLDSRYLLLGLPLPEGMTHAEYAHRGAYPLIATAVLAGVMVLAVFRPGGIAERSAWARRLVLLWVFQNVLLVFSALWRLSAYVEVYTLTRLRVAAAVWMLMVAGTLFLLIWRIAAKRDNAWMTGWAMGWALAVLWLCSFIPFDVGIAQYNVRNCRELGGTAGPIDVDYLEHLGPDALPAVAYLAEHLPHQHADTPLNKRDTDADVVFIGRSSEVWHDARSGQADTQTLGERVDAIRADLSDELQEELADWRGWTVRRDWLMRSAVVTD